MQRLKDILKKQGGIELIKQYAKGGALFTAIGEFVLLGKSRTALEILRLSATLKIKQKLQRKYKGVLEQFDREYDESVKHEKSDKVWVCWFQGMDRAPHLVRACYRSLRENLPDKEIILITSENMSDYVTFPDYIIKKKKKEQKKNTHMTDLLRLELLIQYGGTWVDATVLCTSKQEQIPDWYFNSNLFFFQTLKPGRDGQTQFCSSWFISAKTNNRILMAVLHLCYEYWKTNTKMVDYYLFHDFLTIVLEHYPEEWNKVVPCDNASPHILLLRLFEVYDVKLYEAVKMQSPFHKLSYKFSDEQIQLKGTFYEKLFGSDCNV